MQAWVDVDGHKVRLENSLPSTAAANKLPALVLLHGAGGHAEFWQSRLAAPLAQAGVALFVPHYFDRTRTAHADLTVISDGIHVPLWIATIRAAVAMVAAHPAVDADRIALLGVSLGAFLGLAFAAEPSPEASRKQPVRCMVELSGGLVEPYRSRADSSFPPTLILHGAADTVVPASFAHELDVRLAELGVPHETLVLPGEGHWFGGAAQMQLLLKVSSFLGRHL